MKKEYFLVLILALFILSSVLDFLAGPAKPALKIPFDFLKPAILAVYPLTAVSVGVKTLFISLALLLGFSMIEDLYLAKALALFFLAVLSELYAIQQIATNSRVTPLEWTLGFAATGIVLLLPAMVFMVIGAVKTVHNKLTAAVDKTEEPPA